MAVRIAYSFDDTQTIAHRGIVADVGTPTISTSAPRTGAQALRITGGSTPHRAALPIGSAFALNAVIGVAFGYRPGWNAIDTGSVTSANNSVAGITEGSTIHLQFKIHADGNLAVYRAGTTLLGNTTTPPGFAKDVYSHWEVKCRIHDTTGLVEVKINGVAQTFTWVTGTSSTQDTRNGGSGTADTLKYASQSGSTSDLTYVDDVIVWDTTGSDVTDYIGDQGVFYVPPTGAGNYAQTTPSAGSNWQNVDDIGTVDDDTTYNSSSTAGQKDTFTKASITATSVVAVQALFRARKDDVGSRTLRPIFRRSSTDYSGTTVSLNAGYTTYTEVFHNDPSDSGDWTDTDVNNTEFGYEVVS